MGSFLWISVVLVTFAPRICSGLKCYGCGITATLPDNSVTAWDTLTLSVSGYRACQDTFEKKSDLEETCATGQDRCMKLKYDELGVWRRGCATAAQCNKKVDGFTVMCCVGDICNSASLASTSILLTLITLILVKMFN